MTPRSWPNCLDSQAWILCLMTLVLMMGSSAVAPVLPLFAQEFGVSYAGAGALISAFALGRIPFSLVGGRLADRLSPRQVATAGAFLVMLSAFLSGLAKSFPALILYRILDGAGSAIFVITAMALLVRTTAPQQMGKAMSLYQGAVLLGVAFGPVMGGTSASFFGSLRAPFFLMALFALGVAAFSFLWIEELPPQLQPGNRTVAPAAHTVPSSSQIRNLLRDPTFLFACLLTTLVFAIRSGIRVNLVPLLAGNVLGLSEAWIGLVLSLTALANLAVLWHAGSLLDRLGRRRVALPSLWISFIVVLSFVGVKSLFSLFLAMTALGVVMGYLAPAPAAMVADLASPAVAGSAMGIYRTAGDLGLFLGPVSMGWAAEHFGFAAAFVLAGVYVLLVLLLGLRARETLLTLPAPTRLC